ncbi:uncharacterized protein OCT59_011469 [Rhizophagus irregularis]|uniref:uncharacterized protein n=1 Tax=Rhizophagus irregularis TaxID=588596 RepID=UPI00331C1617|nr:hypothetical protein OCT59_011469 [Rhizophagus irregularis]
MDQFIFKNKLKWISYDKFENINKYSDKEGFGTIYKAKYKRIKVILKDFNHLNNSDECLNEFLNEWKIIDSNKIIKIYGFTKNPDTLNYILIMEYIDKEKKIEDINEELRSNIMEFINASNNNYINHTVKFHPQAYYTSRLLDFTSINLNEILFLKLKQELFKLEKIIETNDQSSYQMEKNDLQAQLIQLKANIQESKFQQDQFKNLLI